MHEVEISESNAPVKSLAGLKELAKTEGIKMGIFRTRLTITLVMAVHFFAYLFIEGPVGYLSGFKFFTCWSEGFTLAYFVYLMYSNPFGVNVSHRVLVVEHAILMCQVIVILVYWAVLVPFLGLGTQLQQKYFAVYLHTFPFLGTFRLTAAIYNEFQITRGCYSHKGIGLFFITISIYYAFNVCLELFLGIVVYPTKMSSGFGLENLVSVSIVFTIMYFFGFAILKLKSKQFKRI